MIILRFGFYTYKWLLTIQVLFGDHLVLCHGFVWNENTYCTLKLEISNLNMIHNLNTRVLAWFGRVVNLSTTQAII